jgi:YD repeat-containing protein
VRPKALKEYRDGPYPVVHGASTAGATQPPRTFTWSGNDLASATNPENGTVTYTYDGAHHVTSRTDAKGQQTQYQYDTYERLVHVSHYPRGPNNPEDSSQAIDYYYDYSPADYDSGYSWERLTQVTFQAGLKPLNFT